MEGTIVNAVHRLELVSGVLAPAVGGVGMVLALVLPLHTVQICDRGCSPEQLSIVTMSHGWWVQDLGPLLLLFVVLLALVAFGTTWHAVRRFALGSVLAWTATVLSFWAYVAVRTAEAFKPFLLPALILALVAGFAALQMQLACSD
jgi:hypothetical protein